MTKQGNLVSSSLDHTVKVWSYANGSLLCTMNAHTDTVNALAYISDLGALVSGSSDGTIYFWMYDNCSMQQSVSYSGVQISALYTQSINNNWCVVIGSRNDGVIRLLNLNGFATTANVTVTSSSIQTTCVIMLPILQIVSGHSDGSLHITNPFQDGGATSSIQAAHTQSVTCLLVAGNDSFLSTAGDGELKSWYLDSYGNYTLTATFTGVGSNIAALVMLSASTFLSAQSANVLSLWTMSQSMNTPTSNVTVSGMNASSMVANYYVSCMKI
jgi:WD40 repeat protein